MSAAQAACWLGTTRRVAYRRLQALAFAECVTYVRPFDRESGCYLATTAGLAAVRSPLPAPRVDPRSYRHDLGLTWLWLQADARSAGSGRVVSERVMRSQDGRGDGPGWAVGDRAARRGHYPDLVVEQGGRRFAIELELSIKSPRRLDRILTAYVRDSRVERILYFTDRPDVRGAVEAAVRRVRAEELVVVRDFHWDAGSPITEPGVELRAAA